MTTEPEAPTGVRIVLDDGTTFDALGVHYAGVRDGIDHWHAVFPEHVIDDLIAHQARLQIDVLPGATALGLSAS